MDPFLRTELNRINSSIERLEEELIQIKHILEVGTDL